MVAALSFGILKFHDAWLKGIHHSIENTFAGVFFVAVADVFDYLWRF